jgi:uncharacterized protein (AIM24 family)
LAQGQGSLALQVKGQSVTLKLEKGQSFLVDPRQIIAWESCLSPESMDIPHKDASPKTVHQTLTAKTDPDWKQKVLELGAKSLDWTSNKARQAGMGLLNSFKRKFLGVSDYYKLVGPGQVILASGSSPRLMEALASVLPERRSAVEVKKTS